MILVFMKHKDHQKVRSKQFDDLTTARGFCHGYNYAAKAFELNATAWVQEFTSPRPSPPHLDVEE